MISGRLESEHGRRLVRAPDANAITRESDEPELMTAEKFSSMFSIKAPPPCHGIWHTSALLRAGASLTPSPIMQTLLFSTFSFSIQFNLSSGNRFP